MTDPQLRRAELAVATFGLTALLLALLFAFDALRFHGDVLAGALAGLPRGEVHAQGLLLIAVALFDGLALIRVATSLVRGVSAERRLARVPVLESRLVAGRRVAVVAGARPLAFCAGLLRPRVYVSDAALARLGGAELAAVVAHEGHHAARRDPLRLLLARALGDACSLRALPRREQALADLAADDAAARAGGAAPLAAALLAVGGERIAPERVDRLAGERPRGEVPRALVAGAAAVLVALALLLALGVVLEGHLPACLPLASAPAWWLGTLTARVAAMAPAWLGWRRAAAYLRVASP